MFFCFFFPLLVSFVSASDSSKSHPFHEQFPHETKYPYILQTRTIFLGEFREIPWALELR